MPARLDIGLHLRSGLAHAWPLPRHAHRIADRHPSSYGSASEGVLLYWVETAKYQWEYAYINVRSPDSTFLLVRYPLCNIVGSGARAILSSVSC